jgi:hypothetical protein
MRKNLTVEAVLGADLGDHLGINGNTPKNNGGQK